MTLAVAIGIGRFAFTPILPMMQDDAGLSVVDGGRLASANYLGYLLGALSAVGVRVRARRAIRFGLVVIGIVTLAMGVANGFVAWVVLRALAGIATAWVLVFGSAWCLANLAALRRQELGGVVFAGVGTGIAIAGGACLILTEIGASSAQAWIGLGAISLFATALIWRTFARGDEMAADDDRRPITPGELVSGDSLRLTLCYGAYGFGYIIPATFLPVMARQLISNPLIFGWSWPVFGAAAVVSTVVAARFTRRIANRRQWILGHVVMAIGVGIPIAWRTIGGIMIAALLVGGTFMVVTMTGMQEGRTVGGDHARGLMAAMTSAFGAGQIAGPMLVSSMVGNGGDFSRPLLVASVLLAASAYALSRPGRRAAPAC